MKLRKSQGFSIEESLAIEYYYVMQAAADPCAAFLLYRKLRKVNGSGREGDDDWYRVSDVGAGTARFFIIYKRD